MFMTDNKNLIKKLELFDNTNEDYVELNPIRIWDFETDNYEECLKELNNEINDNILSYYFTIGEYINNFIFVSVSSGRKDAISTSLKIANRTKHKFKHQFVTGASVVMIFKKHYTCNQWK